jgi:alpha-L-arabinofuranosidase
MKGTIVIDPGTTLRENPARALGMNVNYLMDHDANRPGARSLADALRDMGVGALRYPGGEKADGYFWSVPPYNRSQPTLARVGPGQWPSGDASLVSAYTRFKNRPLDFDEFMGVARSVGAEPVIVVCFDASFPPAASGVTIPSREALVEVAVEWVRYANIRKKYGIRYWEIGNESYMEGYNGLVSAEDYGRGLARFAAAMKSVDPGILVGAQGPNEPGDPGAVDKKAGRTEPWWKTVFAHAGGCIDWLADHDYPCWKWGSYEYYRTASPSFTSGVDGVLAAAARWCPEDRAGRLRVSSTEINAVDWAKPPDAPWLLVNDLGHALVLFEMIGRQIAHPRLDFAMVWNTRWVGEPRTPPSVFDALDADNMLNPTGRAVAIWGRFLKRTLVRAESLDTVKAFASADPVSGGLSVFLLNKDTEARDISVTITGAGRYRRGERWLFAGSGPEDCAPSFTQASAVAVRNGEFTVRLDPVSLNVVELKPG